MPEYSTQPGPSPGKTPKLPSLTGMRFIGLALVWFFHASFENLFANGAFQMMPDPMNHPLQRGSVGGLFWQGGWTGLTFFFVLSGFVLTWSARPTDSTRKFYRRRFFKIYPNNLLTYVAAFFLVTEVAHTAISTPQALLDLFLLQAWPPPSLTGGGYVNATAWSLSCEALFYLSFPLLLKVVNKIRPERLWASAGVTFAIVALVPLAATLLPASTAAPWAQSNELSFWLTFTFPPSRMLEFVFGMFMARIVLTHRRLPFGLGGSVALAVAVYALSPRLPLTYPLVATMLVPIGLIMANTALLDVRGRKNILSGRVMVWLGELSFAFYLWHMMVLMYGHQLLNGAQGFSTPVAVVVTVGMFATTLLLAWLTYTFVEKPMMKRFAVSRRKLRLVADPAALDGAPPAAAPKPVEPAA